MLSLKKFYSEIKARKIRKRLVIYLSSSITVLGVVNLFSRIYDFPFVFFNCVLVALLCGIPSTLVHGWYHGLKKKQRMQKREIIFHTFIFVVAAVLIIRTAGTSRISLLPPDAKFVAVLPFQNLNDSKEDEYFSDGIMEDILTQLSKIGDLKVISRTSVMQYKNTKKNLREIADELGVASILEGSVRRTGNRVRITSQLINARSDEHLWAETYDREMKDIFEIQSDVAKSIAAALHAVLSPNEIEQIDNPGTENLDAYGFYLRGRDYFYNYTNQDNERAIELYREALKVDPNYALAYAGLAEAYGRKIYYDYSQDWSDSSLTFSNRAIELNPNLAEGYKALGDVYNVSEDYSLSLIQYLKAIKLNPNYAAAIANIGFTHYKLGAFDEALVWMKKAMMVEPGSARWTSNVAVEYYNLGFDSLATVWFQRAMALQPEFFFPKVVMTYIDIYAGKYDSARATIKNLLESYPEVPPILETAGDIELLAGNLKQAKTYFEKAALNSSFRSESGIKLAYVLTKLNKRAEAKEILDENLADEADDLAHFKEGNNAYFIAAAYVISQNYKKAIQVLSRAVELGYRNYRWFSVDPMMVPLRNNPEFFTLAAKLKSEYEKMRSRVKTENL